MFDFGESKSKLISWGQPFHVYPPRNSKGFPGIQLSILKKPSTKLISDNSWWRFCHRRSRASFFWYFLSQTLRTRRECGKANLPVAFLRNAGWTWLWYWSVKWIQMSFYLKNLWRRNENEKNTVLQISNITCTVYERVCLKNLWAQKSSEMVEFNWSTN